MRCKQHTARTFDAVKITVLSACAAMADRIVRIWPMDDRQSRAKKRGKRGARAWRAHSTDLSFFNGVLAGGHPF